MSLGTRRYREAEHLAGLLDAGFNEALAKARRMTDSPDASPDLAAILREHLRRLLDLDLAQRINTQPRRPTFATPHTAEERASAANMTAQEADLEALGLVLADAHDALRDRDPRSVAAEVRALMARHELPDHLRTELGIGCWKSVYALWKKSRGASGARRRLCCCRRPARAHRRCRAGAFVRIAGAVVLSRSVRLGRTVFRAASEGGQPLGREADHLTQEGGIRPFRQKVAKGSLLLGHRGVPGQGCRSQLNPTQVHRGGRLLHHAWGRDPWPASRSSMKDPTGLAAAWNL